MHIYTRGKIHEKKYDLLNAINAMKKKKPTEKKHLLIGGYMFKEQLKSICPSHALKALVLNSHEYLNKFSLIRKLLIR